MKQRSDTAKNNSLISSLSFAIQGIFYCFRTQRNFRVHILAAAAVFILAWRLGLTDVEVLILALTVVLVLLAEMFNTAMETVVDLVSPEYNPLAKVAKDIAAGAVLIAAIISLAVGYFLFVRKLL